MVCFLKGKVDPLGIFGPFQYSGVMNKLVPWHEKAF